MYQQALKWACKIELAIKRQQQSDCYQCADKHELKNRRISAHHFDNDIGKHGQGVANYQQQYCTTQCFT